MDHLPAVAEAPAEVLQAFAQRDWRFDLACWMARVLPRGKGALPRFIGRHLATRMRTHVSTAAGGRLAVVPEQIEFYVLFALHGRRYEPHVVDTCARLLSPGAVFWDIGAFAGSVTVDVALRSGATVVAVEPQPAMARAVRCSMQLSGVTGKVLELSVGDQEGEADLFVVPNGINASLVPRALRHRVLRICMVTLDQVLESVALPPPGVVKIDVEGAELQVLRGARTLLSRHRPTLVLEADANMARFRYSTRDLVEALRACGPYTCYQLCEDGTLRALSEADCPGQILATCHPAHALRS